MLGYRKIGGYLITHKPNALVLSKILAVSMNDGSFTNRELRRMQRLDQAIGDSKHFDLEIHGKPTCRAFWIHYTFHRKGDDLTINLESEIEFLEKLLRV